MSRIYFDRELDTVASYWRIHRKDGVALAFTTHDRDLYFGGMLHRSAPGMLPSAIRRTIDLSDDEAEVDGALSHDTIKRDDLLSGRFDGASIETGVVDWETLESSSLYAGSVDAVSQDASGFSAQLRSVKADLDIDPVPRSSPSCRARFGGPGCAISATRFETRSSAVSLDRGANSVSFPLEDLQSYVHGQLRWLDGPQTGLSFRIIDQQDGALFLDRQLDEGTTSGSRAILRQGCERTIACCSQRFGNALNFQGEPYLPGNDLIVQYPQPR